MADADLALVRLHSGVTAGIASGLRDALGWAVDHHAGVVVDLAGAPTMDLVGLGVLVRAQRRRPGQRRHRVPGLPIAVRACRGAFHGR